MDAAVAEAVAAAGSVDVVVNAAGYGVVGAVEELSDAELLAQLDANLLGVHRVLRAVLPGMRAAGGGTIVNISSVVSTYAPANAAVYSATKAAVDAVTRSLAKELGPRHIRVNSINPGMVETEGTHSAGITESDMRTQTEAQTPLGRIGQPRDIAPAVAFLASDDAAWITGETWYISGGLR